MSLEVMKKYFPALLKTRMEAAKVIILHFAEIYWSFKLRLMAAMS